MTLGNVKRPSAPSSNNGEHVRCSVFRSAIVSFARRYAHHFPCSSAEDLEQQGYLAALESGDGSARDAMRFYAWREHAPCSATRNCHRSAEALKAQASRTDAAPDLGHHDTPEDQLDAALLSYRVQRALHAHLEAEPELAPGVAVALYAEPAREVARERGLPVERVYDLTEKLKRRLRNDESMRQLWAERAA